MCSESDPEYGDDSVSLVYSLPSPLVPGGVALFEFAYALSEDALFPYANGESVVRILAPTDVVSGAHSLIAVETRVSVALIQCFVNFDYHSSLVSRPPILAKALS